MTNENQQKEVDQEIKPIISNKTEEFIQQIGKLSEGLVNQAITKAEKDFTISLDFTKNMLNNSVDSKEVKRITINKEKNTIGILLYNSFVYEILSKTLEVDFNKVYVEVKKDFKKLYCFNRFISDAVKTYKNDLVKSI